MRLAREVSDEVDPDGKRKYTVAQIADEFGVTRPTIYATSGRQQADQVLYGYAARFCRIPVTPIKFATLVGYVCCSTDEQDLTA